MKKTFAIMVSVMVLAVSLAGCGNEKKSENSAENSAVQNVQEADYSLPTELTDNLFDYRVQIGDDVLVAPMTLRHLKEAGWTSDETKYPTVGCEEKYPIDFAKGDEFISVNVKNVSANNQNRLTDDGASYIAVEDMFCVADPVLNTKPIILPKGITSGVSKAEDVIAAYGEPQEIEERYDAMGTSLTGYAYVYYDGDKLDSYKNADRYIVITISYFGDKVKKNDWTVARVQLHAVS